jgi:hypothetical protein
MATRLSARLAARIAGGDPVTDSMYRNTCACNAISRSHGRFLLRLCIDVSQELVRRRLPIRA